MSAGDVSAPRDNNGAYDLADLDGTPMNFGIAEDDDMGQYLPFCS
jgi:hypothetical protein